MDIDYEKFRTLGQLLDAHSPATLATAIEQFGIYGWDRFGRYMHYTSKSKPVEVNEALDALAAHYEWLAAVDRGDRMSPKDWGEGFVSYARYGWPEGKDPDFKQIGSTTDEMPFGARKAPGEARTERASTAIIGALLMFIKGLPPYKAHPRFRSENDLIELLSTKYAGYPGMSRRNLIDKFRDAKKIVDSGNPKLDEELAELDKLEERD